MPEHNQLAKAKCYTCGREVRWKGQWVHDRSMGQAFVGPGQWVAWWVCSAGHQQPGGFNPDEQD